MKITAAQIKEIDKALCKMGIAYMDIRCELTDHIANELEGKEGDFKTELTAYLKENKKQLRRTNRKMFFSSSGGAYLEVFKTLARPAFIAGYLLTGAAMQLLYRYMEREDAVNLFFLLFCIISSYTSFAFLFRMFYHKRSYSGSIGFSLVIMALLYLNIFMMDWQRAIESNVVITLYFSFILISSAAMLVTAEKQYRIYKLRYA
jgi:hypothetical protein